MAEGEKTEKATPKKRRDERKKGHVFLSKDAVSVASLIGSVMILRATFRGMVEQISAFTRYCMSLARDNTLTMVPKELMTQCDMLLARTVGPLLAVTVFVTVVATMAQTRMLISFELIKPKFD